MERMGAGTIIKLGSVNVYMVEPLEHSSKVVTAVVLLHGSAGPLVDYCINYADRIAEQGYKVMLPDLLEGQTWSGIPASSVSYNKWEKSAQHHHKGVKKIVLECVDYLKNECSVLNVGCIGIEWGGDLAINLSQSEIPIKCFVSVCPKLSSLDNTNTQVRLPLLCILGPNDAPLNKVHELNSRAQDSGLLNLVSFSQQDAGFAFSSVSDEDSAVQAIAYILEWFMEHLHSFKPASCTSDGDKWWPQGRRGPFMNIGLKDWLAHRREWLVVSGERRPPPPPISTENLLEDMSSMSRAFELPGRMALSDIVEVLVEIWDAS